MEDQTFLYKEKCLEALQSSFVADLPTVNVVEIDSGMGLYEGFQVCFCIAYFFHVAHGRFCFRTTLCRRLCTTLRRRSTLAFWTFATSSASSCSSTTRSRYVLILSE